MLWQSSPYVYLMLLAGTVSAVAAYLTWRRRPAPGSTALVFVNAAGALWGWACALELASAALGDGVVVTDTRDRLVYLNAAAEELLGVKLGAVTGKAVAELIVGSPGLLAVFDDRDGVEATGPHEWQNAGRFYHGRVTPLLDGRGRERGRVLVLRDITARKTAELALEEARRELEVRVDERTAELAAEKDRLAGLNCVAVEIAHCMTTAEVQTAGLRLACEAIGCENAALWVVSRGTRPRLTGTAGLRAGVRQELRELLAAWEPTDDLRVQVWPDLLGNGLAVVPLVARRISLGGLCLLCSDRRYWEDEERLSLATGIASQIALALQNAKRYDDAQFLAERDSLTRLLNHRGLSRRVEQQVAHAAHDGTVFCLVMMDIDNFKLFNDAYGHVTGDKVLQMAARSLTSALRRSDDAARCGGDEFVAILPECDVPAALRLLERVRGSLQRRSLQVGGQSIPIKMSYGVATFPRDGSAASELLAAADANLYRSKRRGGDCITASESEDGGRHGAVGAYTVLDGLVTTVDSKDHYTRKHSEDVTEYAVALAARLDLSPDTQRALRIAGLLHDVGKVGVPDYILHKPAALNDEELAAIKQHVALGELIIKGIPNQQEVVTAISGHHERIDGKGYPRGLVGRDIPLLGRILAVADAYSAMISDRPYRQALTAVNATAELRRVAGTQLDPEVVAAFLELLEDYEAAEQEKWHAGAVR
jgi:diguanylate cyclase (GGDEF)-like protein/PAS domain S-box-containing protein/putative nucleotidyltransferase with HDIG domain